MNLCSSDNQLHSNILGNYQTLPIEIKINAYQGNIEIANVNQPKLGEIVSDKLRVERNHINQRVMARRESIVSGGINFL